MNATGIEYCDMTANPIRAGLTGDDVPGSSHGGFIARGHYCEKISPGCANCYASTLQARFAMRPFPGATPGRWQPILGDDRIMQNGVAPYLDLAVLAKISKGRKPKRVFLGDMTDLFGWWVPDEWLDKIFAAMAVSPHTFLILTKRPERMRDYLIVRYNDDRFWIAADERLGYESTFDPRPRGIYARPLPNVWLGVSAEDQKRWDERVPILLQTPAAVRFVSAEPLLGPLDMARHFRVREGGVDWVIVGGESGRNARPCRERWIADTIVACHEFDVPLFVKQLRAVPEPRDMIRHPKGGDMTEWPEGLRVREFPA